MKYQLRATFKCKPNCINGIVVGKLLKNNSGKNYVISDINMAHKDAELCNTTTPPSGCKCLCKVVEKAS